MVEQHENETELAERSARENVVSNQSSHRPIKDDNLNQVAPSDTVESEKPKAAKGASADPFEGKTADELEAELKAGGACGKNCLWISCCLMAGFMMGTGAFIFASNYADYGLKGTGLLGPGAAIVYFLFKAIKEIIYRSKHGRWTKEKDSSWRKDDGSIRWMSIVPIAGNVACNIGYTIVMTFAWRFAEQAGLNQGVISSMLCFASVINIVVFYCAFNEKVSCINLIGVALMFAGIVCIGAAAATSEDSELDPEVDTGGRSTTVNGILALVVGFGGPMIISTQHYVIRKFSTYYTGLDQAIDAAFPTNLIFCFFLIPLADEMTITMKDLGIGLAAEALMETARILLSFGVEVGLAGPAQALMSTHALWQALCGAAFADQDLTGLQIAGILLGLAGVSSISLFDHLMTKAAMRKEIQKRRAVENAQKKAGADANSGANALQ